MGAKNKVIAGDYKGKMVICALGDVSISTSFTKSVAIRFKDRKQSLLEVNDKIYKAIVKSCF